MRDRPKELLLQTIERMQDKRFEIVTEWKSTKNNKNKRYLEGQREGLETCICMAISGFRDIYGYDAYPLK